MNAIGVSQQELGDLLARCGYHISKRRMTDWISRGWLPPMTRVGRLSGGGRGARYVWTDPDVVLRGFTLLAMRELRGRMETATVLTWFCGFDYPIEPMRGMWVSFEERPWRQALKGVADGGPLTIGDAVTELVFEAKRARKARRMSSDFVDALIRFDVDPDFEPDALTAEQAELIRKDLSRLSPASAELMDSVEPHHIKAFLALIHDFWSAPKLVDLLRGLSNEELAFVHHDCRLVLGLYRGWLREAIDGINKSETQERLALWLGPRLAWQAGRFLMRLDILLRRLGLGPQIDATLEYLTHVATDPETRRLLQQCRRDYEQIVAAAGQDPIRIRGEFQRRAEVKAEFKRLSEIGDTVFEALEKLWEPVVHELRDALSGAPAREGDPAPANVGGQATAA